MNWAEEYLAASQVTDMARDPDDYRRSVQSAVTVGGLLVSVSATDQRSLEQLFIAYSNLFAYYHSGNCAGVGLMHHLTATMQAALKRSALRAKGVPDSFKHISIDPRDYTILSAPHVDVPIVCIHTRPERCWFLGVLKFDGALGLSLGRMRVMRPNEKGMYPVTIRTKWRALTNKVKQEEVRSAYRRLIQ